MVVLRVIHNLLQEQINESPRITRVLKSVDYEEVDKKIPNVTLARKLYKETRHRGSVSRLNASINTPKAAGVVRYFSNSSECNF